MSADAPRPFVLRLPRSQVVEKDGWTFHYPRAGEDTVTDRQLRWFLTVTLVVWLAAQTLTLVNNLGGLLGWFPR